MDRTTGSCNNHLLTLYLDFATKRALFPLLEVAHQAIPRALLGGLEHQFVVRRLGRLKQEHLDEGTCILAEMHTSLDNLGVIKHHESTLGQILGEVIEYIVTYLALTVNQQLRVVALGNREFSNTLIGERIIIIADTNMSWIGIHIIQALINTKTNVNTNTPTGQLQSKRR